MVQFTENINCASATTDTNHENGTFVSPTGKKFDKKTEQKRDPGLVLELKKERSFLSGSDAVKVPLTFDCIQGLILQALIRKKAPQTWYKFVNRNIISNVTLVIIDGWDLKDLHSITSSASGDVPLEKERKVSKDNLRFNQRENENDSSLLERVEAILSLSSSCFPLKFEVESPCELSNEPIVELFSCTPISASLVGAIKEKYRSLKRAAKAHIISPVPYEDVREVKPKEKFSSLVEDHQDKFSRVDLLLSFEEMARFKYPLGLKGEVCGKDSHYLPLHPHYDKVTPISPMFGIDCEMCTTLAGTELTRISVLDEKFKVIYSSFVKPSKGIVNYLTKYSGVTPDLLMNVTTTLSEVQQKLRQILPKDCILVGHSLECDLAALKLGHPYCIDTSLIYNLSRNAHNRPSLKLLAKLFLKKDIQNKNRNGHNPSEDAATALELVLLKLRNNISFGDVKKGGKLPCSKSNYLKALKNGRAEKCFSLNSMKNAFGENYGSTILKIIKLETENKSLAVTNDTEAKDYFESYGVDYYQMAQSFNEVFEIEPEANTNFKFIVRHCQVPDILTIKKFRKKLRKKLHTIDKKLRALHETMPQKSLILALFTKRTDLSVPKEIRPKSLLLLDFKGQDFNSFL